LIINQQLVVMTTMLVPFADVFFRVIIERLLAAGGAEVIGLSFVLGLAGRGLGIDIHTTNGIFMHYVHLLSIVRLLQALRLAGEADSNGSVRVKRCVPEKTDQSQYDQQGDPTYWGRHHPGHHGHAAHCHATAKEQYERNEQYGADYDQQNGSVIHLFTPFGVVGNEMLLITPDNVSLNSLIPANKVVVGQGDQGREVEAVTYQPEQPDQETRQAQRPGKTGQEHLPTLVHGPAEQQVACDAERITNNGCDQ